MDDVKSFSIALCIGLMYWTSTGAQTLDGGAQIWISTANGSLEGNDKVVKLEATLYTPRTTGKHPVLIFNHGLVSGFSRVKYDELAETMISRGIAVIMPMRRGLGESEGTQNQPHSCDTAINEAGVQHAIEDIDAALAYVRNNPSLDAEQILLGGNSRGGILSLVYAARRKTAGLKGIINFVGTWNDDRSCRFDDINGALFKEAGAGSTIPALWLYGEGDSYNSDKSVKDYAETFRLAGGNLTFRLYTHDFWNGHKLLEKGSKFWRPDVTRFLDRLNFAGRY